MEHVPLMPPGVEPVLHDLSGGGGQGQDQDGSSSFGLGLGGQVNESELGLGLGPYQQQHLPSSSSPPRPVDDGDTLIVTPLGAGQEVGRSCIMLEYKGKKILLDMGIHPGRSGLEALPFIDFVDADEIDLLLVSHFHLDHAGALPWFMAKTTFNGRTFMTHATKAIYRWLLSDYIKVSNLSTEYILYTEADLEASMQKIEVLNFHEEKEVKGIRFWAYHAGHVLGAAMFMIEIAGIRVLYTGDFSRLEDRHLMAAEIPTIRPDVMICESTYGTHIHEDRETRENRFTSTVHGIVARSGRCLIPVFALGRAQELLLILDEYWSQHPELHSIPIFYASSLARKCMTVYQTFINAMNDRIQRQVAISNPFIFKHISYLKHIDHFEDSGPCVVMASPGMLQSGLSRDLFEMWCTDSKNGVIIAGYCVEGTLAKQLLSEPQEVKLSTGKKVPLKMSVDYISFSAHTDFVQTSEFIRALKPPHLILVHGEQNEMSKLAGALNREYEGSVDNIKIHCPKNTKTVELNFKGEKTAKLMGSLIDGPTQMPKEISGILVKRNFKYNIVTPDELGKYTDLTRSVITQRQSVTFSGSFELLHHVLVHMAKKVKVSADEHTIRVFDIVDVTYEPNMVTLEWIGTPNNDMYADAVLVTILQADSLEKPIPSPSEFPPPPDISEDHYRESVVSTLQEMFGENSVSAVNKDCSSVLFNGTTAEINFKSRVVTCEKDPKFQQIIQGVITNLHIVIMPIEPEHL